MFHYLSRCCCWTEQIVSCIFLPTGKRGKKMTNFWQMENWFFFFISFHLNWETKKLSEKFWTNEAISSEIFPSEYAAYLTSFICLEIQLNGNENAINSLPPSMNPGLTRRIYDLDQLLGRLRKMGPRWVDLTKKWGGITVVAAGMQEGQCRDWVWGQKEPHKNRGLADLSTYYILLVPAVTEAMLRGVNTDWSSMNYIAPPP